MKYLAITLWASLALISLDTNAQINGIWEVVEFRVNDNVVGPFSARWVDFREDGTFIQGIGGRIEENGFWELEDTVIKTSLPGGGNPRVYGIELEVGDSTAVFNMIHDGQHVVAKVKRRSLIPRGAWDECVGEWVNTDPDTDDMLSMYFNQRFIHKVNGAGVSGFWVISTDMQSLTVVEDNGKISKWTISFPSNSTMHLKSEFGEGKEYKRAN